MRRVEEILHESMAEGMNALLEGYHGVGKTQMVLESVRHHRRQKQSGRKLCRHRTWAGVSSIPTNEPAPRIMPASYRWATKGRGAQFPERYDEIIRNQVKFQGCEAQSQTIGCKPPRNEKPLKHRLFLRSFRGFSRMGRAGIEPATHGFSDHCSTS